MTSEQEHLIKAAENFVKEKLSGESSGHDWWHIFAVRRNAIKIFQQEGGDRFLIEMAVLLHDVDDQKIIGKSGFGEPKSAKKFLLKLGMGKDSAEKICSIIKQVSFKGAGVSVRPRTLEAKIVQDADRLEALGAMGIARTFAVGAKFNRPLFDPEIRPRPHRNQKEYEKRSSCGTSFNHFYEKILLLKNLMNTKTGRSIAEKRHHFVLKYIKQFRDEWEGRK